MLKPRLARTCLKHFLDPSRPIGTHYGGIIGLQAIGGPELVRALIVPNLREYDGFLIDLNEETDNEANKKGGEMMIEALVDALISLEVDSVGAINRLANGPSVEMGKQVGEKIGELLGGRVMELGRPRLVKAILEC